MPRATSGKGLSYLSKWYFQFKLIFNMATVNATYMYRTWLPEKTAHQHSLIMVISGLTFSQYNKSAEDDFDYFRIKI